MSDAAGTSSTRVIRRGATERIKWRSELRFPQGAEFEASLGKVSKLLAEMGTFLKSVPGLKRSDVSSLRLVCDELAANAVRHISPIRPVRVRVDLTVDPRRVRLSYRDDGEKFDSLRQEEPYIGGDLERRKVGGLGLYLIGQMFPDAEYRRLRYWNVVEVACSRSS